MSLGQQMPEMNMDQENLYLEELFTDRKVGAIRRLTPVTADGNPDQERDVVYLGEAQLMTPMGALPLSFEVPGRTLKDAADNYAAAANEAVNQAVDELRRLGREAASSIVVPDMATGSIKGPGGFGAPGGGGIIRP